VATPVVLFSRPLNAWLTSLTSPNLVPIGLRFNLSAYRLNNQKEPESASFARPIMQKPLNRHAGSTIRKFIQR
jgi:hypothetical protein